MTSGRRLPWPPPPPKGPALPVRARHHIAWFRRGTTAPNGCVATACTCRPATARSKGWHQLTGRLTVLDFGVATHSPGAVARGSPIVSPGGGAPRGSPAEHGGHDPQPGGGATPTPVTGGQPPTAAARSPMPGSGHRLMAGNEWEDPGYGADQFSWSCRKGHTPHPQQRVIGAHIGTSTRRTAMRRASSTNARRSWSPWLPTGGGRAARSTSALPPAGGERIGSWSDCRPTSMWHPTTRSYFPSPVTGWRFGVVRRPVEPEDLLTSWTPPGDRRYSSTPLAPTATTVVTPSKRPASDRDRLRASCRSDMADPICRRPRGADRPAGQACWLLSIGPGTRVAHRCPFPSGVARRRTGRLSVIIMAAKTSWRTFGPRFCRILAW